MEDTPFQSRCKKALADNVILFREYHVKYLSHGYRWLNAKIRLDTGLKVSDPYAYKCCKIAGAKANQSITATESRANHAKYVPSAKMMGMNEALFYMGYLPEDTTKVLCIKEAVHPKKQETLAEYYVRIDGHLLQDVKVFEVDEQGRINVVRG